MEILEIQAWQFQKSVLVIEGHMENSDLTECKL